ncbi:MAG: diacylglycerol/lipid kinase family protein [Actinomycetes bacterium]
MTRLLVVTNAAAGTTDDDAVDAALAVLRAGADVRVAASGDRGELERIVAAREDRMLVLVGGDGSVHAAVDTLVRRGELTPDEPLGLIPLGTGNDLARSVGIPLDAAEAARALIGGRPRPMELLRDDADGIVVNAVHLGIGAEAAARGEQWKPRLGKAAYALGGMVAGARTRGWRLKVEADDRVVVDVDRRVLMVGLGLGSSIGGGAPMAPDADPSDGLVDLVVSEAVGPVARIGYGAGLRRGSHVDRSDVHHLRARTVRVGGQPFPVNADGELSGPVRSRSWTVEQGAWALVVPA